MIVQKICESATEAAETVVAMFIRSAPAKVALAGGTTPRTTYEMLAASQLPWTRTDVFLTDERCVPLDNPLSNYRMLQEAFGSTDAKIHPVDIELAPEEAAIRYADDLAPFLPLDFVLLGIGTDGHIASLFPGADLDPGGDVAAAWSKDAGLWRVTMTSRPLLAAREVVYLVTGSEKRPVIERLLRGDRIPAAQIAKSREVTLVCDKDASF